MVAAIIDCNNYYGLDMNLELDAFRKTVEHIALVQRLLLSAQIELARRITTHDQSKLHSPEWEMYREMTHKLESVTYGSDEYEALRREMLDSALGHHFAHNRHHPEHFENGINGMNLFDILEMLIDWMAATKHRADSDIAKSIEINCKRFGISPQLEQIMRNTLPWIEDEFFALKTQADITHSRYPTQKAK
ncbi:DUF5662 family protein [Iningainema tapete]|uniref:Uncharacterized protein n=1 Tax=Iningainema tapete BLCC-T55 TaxID=2748662 RepID=A0A8J7BX21_9CYAN|nr:DUF5662 family protein [Iningainema tapete]MBD2772862.1 hypothetical protein [Iningainema tapete BLCC-T55]